MNGEDLKPFRSDGCSIFPDGTIEQNKLWLQCCVEHDKSYWRGGTYQEKIDADKALHECVADLGETMVADLMLAGVHVGGSAYLPTAFRWGYGWSYLRGYKLLSSEEKIQVHSSITKTANERYIFLSQALKDIEIIQNTRQAMNDILLYMAENPDIFPLDKVSKKRYMTHEQKKVILKTWRLFLDHLTLLDEIEQQYDKHYDELNDIRSRPLAYSIEYAAFLAQYRYAMDFIVLMENDPGMHTLLNEAVPEFELHENSYKDLKFRFLNVIKGMEFANRDLLYVLQNEDIHPLLSRSIDEDRNAIWKKGAGDGPKATAKNAVRIIKDLNWLIWTPDNTSDK